VREWFTQRARKIDGIEMPPRRVACGRSPSAFGEGPVGIAHAAFRPQTGGSRVPPSRRSAASARQTRLFALAVLVLDEGAAGARSS